MNLPPAASSAKLILNSSLLVILNGPSVVSIPYCNQNLPILGEIIGKLPGMFLPNVIHKRNCITVIIGRVNGKITYLSILDGFGKDTDFPSI